MEFADRLEAMIADGQTTWDLSVNDVEAIKWALHKARAVERAEKQVAGFWEGLEEEHAKRRAAEEALRAAIAVAAEAHREWDADNDSRVGKLLLALSGNLPKYRSDIDAIHDALKG